MITHPPGSRLRYPATLRGEDPVKLMMGLSGTFLAFLLTGLLTQAALRVSWFLRGQPDFREYQSLVLVCELPDGILASHLGIAGLLLFVLLIHRYWHGRKAIWVISAQLGGRWWYLLICFVVAAAVLNVVLWLIRGGNMTWQAAQPGWAIYLALILITSPLQAAVEEFFFRGYLQQAIDSLAGQSWVGVARSALVFTIFHGDQNVALFTHRLGFGLITGTLVWATDGLEAAIAVHVVSNVFAFGYALFTGGVTALKATPAVPWEAACSDLASFAVFGALAWWIGRRMHVATLTP